MLEVFITSRVRRKIVVVYAKYPDFKSHVRGLAKLIKEDPGNIQRELKRLVAAGFIKIEKKGGTNLYAANKSFPILRELQAIVIKSQKISKNKKDN
ncbi:MAG: ArsR family transcriptional regulator [Candidatus Nomurabacteria bacterium]|jgi:predicted transcriptional regulator with HTH domain|nr:ArsR family transcriptional regulator [Candidatus Nomurabacteria bacterium]